MTDYIPFTEAQREQARQTDLVAFLRQCGEIVKPSGSEFQWLSGDQKITILGRMSDTTNTPRRAPPASNQGGSLPKRWE